MTDLTSTTPLGAAAPGSETFGSITVAEVTDQSLASVTARRKGAKNFTRAAKSLLGATLPDQGQSAGSGDISAFWIGTDQWLFAASLARHEDLDVMLKEKFGDAATVTMQTDGWACFSIEGSDIGECLLRLVQIDLHGISAGDTIRTLIEHVSCTLICEEPDRAMKILCPRSFAAHLHHALTTAAQSVSGPL